MKKVLVVEDDPKISRVLELELSHEGYITKVVDDGYDALVESEDFKPDVVILDILIPGINGKEVAKRLRNRNPLLGIIMLTALGDIRDKLEAFRYGADDYLVKPFNIEELVARIEAISRRKTSIKETSLSLYGIELFPDQHRLLIDGKDVELSKTELSLLYLLMANEGIVLSKDRILEVVWEDYDGGRENLVEVYINYLRKKLGEKGKYIKTIRGVGYTFRGDA